MQRQVSRPFWSSTSPTFLYVCFRHAVRLASTSINIYIAVYQICALPGGYLADRVLGEEDNTSLTHTHTHTQSNNTLILLQFILLLYYCSPLIFHLPILLLFLFYPPFLLPLLAHFSQHSTSFRPPLHLHPTLPQVTF